MFKDENVLAIQCSNTQKEQYALFCSDKGLYHGNENDGFALLAVLGNISLLNRPIKIYYHFPYVCVTERYGLNASTVNIESGHVLDFAREDYHCDVSSYSVGFLEREDRVLLMHQTQWNRLDITDLETGRMLTHRDIIYQETDETETNKWGTFPKMEKKNYIDYFHSLLHISPNGEHFLSNGWIWQPLDNIMCFDTECFFREYETCGKPIEYYRGYAWDRPCTFAGNDTIVIAADKDEITVEEGVTSAELKEPPAYHQLLFYKLSEIKARNYTYNGYENSDSLPLAYTGKADCDVFAFDEYGEITSGELYYEPETMNLIALSEKGAFRLALDGKILHHAPEIKLSVNNWGMRHDDARAITPSDWLKDWQYDEIHHTFYRFNNNKIEKGYFGG